MLNKRYLLLEWNSSLFSAVVAHLDIVLTAAEVLVRVKLLAEDLLVLLDSDHLDSFWVGDFRCGLLTLLLVSQQVVILLDVATGDRFSE